MTKTRGSLSLLLAGLLMAACSSVGPGTTLPPIVIPSFSIPSLQLPPGLTIPPIVIPSVDPAQSACRLITAAEAAGVLGGTVTTNADPAGGCTLIPSEGFPIVIRSGTSETIATAKMITSNGQDLSIGGAPAYYGELMGGLLYIEKGGQTLVFQAALSTDSKDKLIALANIAITRFP
jgi:hypothetical protein